MMTNKIQFGGKEIKLKARDQMEIAKIMQMQKKDFDAAVEVWLCDEGYMTDPEQAKLLQKSKENKVKMGARAEKPKAKAKGEASGNRKKIDDAKKQIIDAIAEAVGGMGEVKVENPDKLIVLVIDGQEYKINLTKTRAPKEK